MYDDISKLLRELFKLDVRYQKIWISYSWSVILVRRQHDGD